MYILIVNEQPLGRSLAAALVNHGHEVAYVDEETEFCNMVTAEVGCLVIQGETTNLRILQEAGLEQADVVVALMDKDIKNIMVGLFAKQFGVGKILAHLRQQHYRPAYELVGIDNIFSAFDYLLHELIIAIEDPNIRQVMRLGTGEIEIASIDVPGQSPFLNQNLNSLWDHPKFPQGALVLGVLKIEEQAFHLPRERPLIAKDDELLILGSENDIHQIVSILNGKGQRFFKRHKQ